MAVLRAVPGSRRPRALSAALYGAILMALAVVLAEAVLLGLVPSAATRSTAAVLLLGAGAAVAVLIRDARRHR
ncbi:hypothetical protein [Geodermatophilus marinus]|uniref:hypothetical protein n=1 Tax=Geodermatophilus sp. LHW52908 TaxID=2303986 RepID=UPI000E3B72B0|nr:hypothetical protein [Geodermatophilus sp. LHW52908]RFU21300.1 hypothetical protein D0Z06_10975 [Geodermatophilus sp. LHW52908]